MRRLRRSLHSRRDYQHVIELAYGRKGPFKHLLREAEIEASQPPKLARPPRFMLEPLPGASGETFTLASLEKFLDPSTREATGAAAAEREATEASARLQLAVLRELVPTRWVRRAKFAAPREEDASEEDASHPTKSPNDEAGRDRRAWKRDWLPAPWDVDRSPPHEVRGTSRGTGAEARPSSRHWSGASTAAWMVNHLALIRTTFVPAVEAMSADGAIGRAWRRLYASTLGESRRRDVLRIEGAPESWRDPHVPFRSNGNLVLRFRDRVVDEIDPAGMGARDVVARAIDCEIKSAAEAGIEARCVYLDVSHLPADDILEHFPGIAAELKERGLDMTSDRIPVVPAAHYLCGGVRTDLDGQTSLDGLFACGETACTGLHGANRLASNSLLEAVVFANRAFRASADRLANDAADLEPLFAAAEEAAAVEEIRRMAVKGSSKGSVLEYDAHPEWAGVMREEVQRVMWSAAGIVRDSDTIARAEEELERLLARCDAEMRTRGECLSSHELRNLITVGLTVVKCAGMRKESRGLHYNVNYPERVESERRPTVLAGVDKDKGEIGAAGGPAAGEDKKVSFTPR